MKGLPVLEELTIATPCTASWDAMTGNDRVRHCGSCDLDVFNLSGMTRKEAQQLLAGTGRVCIRLFKRFDGTVITQDCPTAIARARRRVASAIAMAVSLAGVSLFGLSATAAMTRMKTGAGSGEGIFASPTIRAITALFTAQPVVQAVHPPMMGAPPPHMGTPMPPPQTPVPNNPTGSTP